MNTDLFLSPFTVALSGGHKASVKHFISLQFLYPKTVGRTPWMGNDPVARLIHIQTQNKHRQTSMSWVGLEPKIPAFERPKTLHALETSRSLWPTNTEITWQNSNFAPFSTCRFNLTQCNIVPVLEDVFTLYIVINKCKDLLNMN
jgi:hypothetical protein